MAKWCNEFSRRAFPSLVAHRRTSQKGDDLDLHDSETVTVSCTGKVAVPTCGELVGSVLVKLGTDDSNMFISKKGVNKVGSAHGLAYTAAFAGQ